MSERAERYRMRGRDEPGDDGRIRQRRGQVPDVVKAEPE